MMGFEEHKSRQFKLGNPYADYEYINKNSRKTWPGLVIALLMGVGLLALGWWRWDYIEAAEQSGGTLSLTNLEWGLYKIGGKWVISSLLFLAGLFFIYAGIQNYQRLEKMKKW